jgi:aminomethyltransferase
VSELLRTPLFERHSSIDARFIDFGGWQLPVQFASIVDEHRAVRNSAGVFDVSHMGRFDVSGSGAHEFLQGRLSNDLDRIGPGEAQYTLLTNEAGGVVDDLIAYRRADDTYLVVVNAANREVDLGSLGDIVADHSDDSGMLAVQGPEALSRLGIEIERLHWREDEVLGVPCLIAGTGYTGEQGCELICTSGDLVTLWDAIVSRGVTPCGLGARDTLRLEVCYPLHGQDISEERDPYSAGLGWAVASTKTFTGSDALAAARKRGPHEKLVAFVMREKGIPRAGMSLVNQGTVTSGAYSPSLDVGIGLAYVPVGDAGTGQEIVVDIRGRHRRALIVDMPIYRSPKEH